MTREPGYYWIREKESQRPPSPAKWDGEYWYFIGSLHMTRDDETDDCYGGEEETRIMDRYEISERIIPPT